jgi:hypothetical protein
MSVFFATYIVVSLIAIFIGIKITVKEDRELSLFRSFLNHIFGFIIVVVIVVLAASKFESSVDGTGLLAMFIRSVITLFTPLAVFAFISPVIFIDRYRSNVTYRDFCAGMLYATLFMPIAVYVLPEAYSRYINEAILEKYCANAVVNVYEKVAPPKSIGLLPDEFTIQFGLLITRQPIIESLVRYSSLEYIEIKKRNTINSQKHERIYVYETNENLALNLTRIPVDNLYVEYTVTPLKIELPSEVVKKAIGGSRILITRVSDNKLIASSEYYWDRKHRVSCPKFATRREYVIDFIFTALGIANSEYRINPRVRPKFEYKMSE